MEHITKTVDTKGKKNLPDPKSKLKLYKDFILSKTLMNENKIDQAIELLERIAKENPYCSQAVRPIALAFRTIIGVY